MMMTTNLEFSNKTELAALLAACPCLADATSLAIVLSCLPSEVRQNKLTAQLVSSRQDMILLVDTCLSYGKLGALYKAVKDLDSGTPAFNRLKDFIFKPYLDYQLAAFERTRFIAPLSLPTQPAVLENKGSTAANSQLPLLWQQEIDLMTSLEPRYNAVTASPPSHKIDPATLKHTRNEQAAPIRVEEALNTSKHLVLLGEPGAGKTTTLQRLFSECSQEWQLTTNSATNVFFSTAPFPLYIPLNLWDAEAYPNLESYLTYLIGQVPRSVWLAQLVAESFQASNLATGYSSSGGRGSSGGGQWLLLLDGLNELPGLKRSQNQVVEDERVDQLARLGSTSDLIVLTCRVNDFIVSGELAGQWKLLHTMPLGAAQIKQFATAMCQRAGKPLEIAARFCSELLVDTDLAAKDKSALTEKERRAKKLQELSAQPFYLIRLACYYLDKEALPERLADLLGYMLKTGLVWARNRNLPATATSETTPESGELIERLGLLAYNMTRRNTVGTATFNQAARWIFSLAEREVNQESELASASTSVLGSMELDQAQLVLTERWLNWASLANLGQRTPGRGMVFSHHLLQEYLAALYATQHFHLVGEVIWEWQFGEVKTFWEEMVEEPVDRALAVLELLDPKASEAKRIAVVAVLAKYPGHSQAARIFELLLSLLQNDPANNVRRSAAAALGQYSKHPQAGLAIAPLVTALADTDWDVRRSAAAALRKYSQHPQAGLAIAPLVTALADTDWDVRRSAADVLGQYSQHPQAEQAIVPLVTALADTHEDVRRNAADVLGQYNQHPQAEQAIVPLVTALADTNWDVRRSAAAALGQYSQHPQAEQAIVPLITALADTNWYVRSSAAGALRKYNQHPQAEQAIVPLVTALADTNWYVRRHAAYVLGQYSKHPQAEQAIVPLVTALADTHEDVRRNAADALGQYNQHPQAEQAIVPLVTALADTNWDVRRHAAYVLGQYNEHPQAEQAIVPLVTALADTHEDVRRNAAYALGQYNEHPQAGLAIVPLVTALADTDWDVRRSAAAALGQYSQHPQAGLAIAPLVTALADTDWDVRRNAAGALGKYNQYPQAEQAIAPLVTALADTHGDVRRSAAGALGKYSQHPQAGLAIVPLVTALADTNWYVRRHAAYVLGQYSKHPQAEQAIVPLVTALADTHEDVRRNAAYALGQYNEHPQAGLAIVPLVTALADTDWDVRRSAAAALGQYSQHPQAEQAIVPLVTALADTHGDVRRNAARALSNFTSPATITTLTEFVEIHPDNYQAYDCLYYINCDLKNYPEAEGAAERLISLNPAIATGYYRKALAMLRRGSQYLPEIAQLFYKAAELQTAEEGDATDSTWLAWWTALPTLLPPDTAAITLELAKIITLATRTNTRSNTITSYTCQGVRQLLQGDYLAATSTLTEASAQELKAGEWDAPFWLGIAHAYSGDIPAAITALDRAVELELPKGLLFPLGWLEVHLGAASQEWQTIKEWWVATSK